MTKTEPAWLEGLAIAAAVDAELGATKGTTGIRLLGTATYDHVRTLDRPGEAVFTVDTGRQALGSLEKVFLRAGASGQPIPADVIAVESQTLVIAAAVANPQTQQLQAVGSFQPGLVLKRLSGALRATKQPRLAGDLLAGRFTRPGTAIPHHELNPKQQQALTETLAPGVNVIWGPPGTGKTHVIAAAIIAAVAQSRSVLLVSNTNVAVDQALERAWSITQSAAGTMVRVGYPSLSSVADHPYLTLERACMQLGGERTLRLADLENRIRGLRDHESVHVFEELRTKLGGASNTYIQAARVRMTTEVLRATLCGRRAVVNDDLVRANAEADAAVEQLRELDARLDALAPFVHRWEQVDKLDSLLADAEATLDRRVVELTELENTLTQTRGSVSTIPQRHLLRRRALRKAVRSLDRECGDMRAVLLRDRAAHVAVRAEIEDRMRDVSPTVNDPSRADIAAVRELHERTSATLAEANRRAAEAKSLLADISRQSAELDSTVAAPTDRDRELLEWADDPVNQADLDRLDALHIEAAPVQQELDALQEEYAQIRGELLSLSATVVQNAGVVATTLAKLCVDRDISKRRYDYVIIDEVSAALFPHVVHAATFAAHGCTLLGDYLQNGPIVQHRDTGHSSPDDVSRYLHTDAFTFLGLNSPAALSATPGCAVLTDQYRFGPVTTELANRIAYGGLLRSAGRWGSEGPEVVLVDTAYLDPELRAVQRNLTSDKRGWSIAGTGLAAALATRHASQGTRVGVITPYSMQAEMTAAALTGIPSSGLVEVGTSHAYQGREFPVVIFDMVEDGRGWMAKASAMSVDTFEFGGLRVLNVAATRNAGRLYLVGDYNVLGRHGTRSLRHIKDLIDEGRIHRVDARTLLGLEVVERSPIEINAGCTDLPTWEIIDERPLEDRAVAPTQQFIPLNSDDFYPHFYRTLETAQYSVHLWAPFFGQRFHEVFPRLRAAIDRGVVVTLVTKPPAERGASERSRSNIELLQQAGVRVLPVMGMHQKIAIVDGSLSYIGSLNILSATTRTQEVMAAFPGEDFATQLLDYELPRQLRSRAAACTKHPLDAFFERRPKTKDLRTVCARCQEY